MPDDSWLHSPYSADPPPIPGVPMRIDPNQPALSFAAFNAARAYGPASAGAISPARAVPAVRVVGGSEESEQRLPTPAQRLVAAVVPGRVDFSESQPKPLGGADASLPLYRHPADKNAAATGVAVGRTLDVSA